MSRLLKAFFYRMSKDLAFRITLIIGCGIALILSVILLVADLMMDMEGIKLLTGHGMLTMSLNPAQNYGIAIPINVAIFVALEFTQGTIRNKIIAGHSKFKIYASLYISGLILGAALLFAYVGFLTIFGTIFGGFDVNVVTILGTGFGAATVDGLVSPAYVVARPKITVNSSYIENVLRTPNAIEHIRGLSYGVADFRLRLYWPYFKGIKIPLPSLEEQNRIVAHIQEQSAKIDALISEKQALIDDLQAYKKSLIYEVVTGKRRVV